MKNFISGMLVVAAMCLSFSGSVANAQSMGGVGDELRWQRMWCTDGSGDTYEVCWLTGDGNECSTYGEQTRSC